MLDIAIIGGTGLTSLPNLQLTKREMVHTPYGEPSGPVVYGKIGQKEVVFLPRHGTGHTIPPHKINYRANIWALHSLGVKKVLAIAAVGGIDSRYGPGCLVVPDQLIDYTCSRVSTFFEDDLPHVTHIDFTYPYNDGLRQRIIEACRAVAGLDISSTGVYGATQGPRLETAAEINRLEKEGCTIVGMTGMPEACLARELELEYATCTVVANWAAGRGEGEISMAEIEHTIEQGMDKVKAMLEKLVLML
ncbi:MAG: S-methyl-5'-thioinosine phosphorylase [Gammaproteobacteria bacterium]|nr:S-methyl-5'-thioinosine phosphorylase [Gammaproteobacteria bacterium]